MVSVYVLYSYRWKEEFYFAYLSEIQTSAEMVEDAGLPDHTAARLLPI